MLGRGSTECTIVLPIFVEGFYQIIAAMTHRPSCLRLLCENILDPITAVESK